LVFYAIHLIAMSHENPLYSSDLTGCAKSILELTAGTVAGFFNGAEGDISPDWDRQNRDDVLSFGERLGGAVTKLQSRPALPTALLLRCARPWKSIPTTGTISAPTNPTGRDGDQGYKEPALGAPVKKLLQDLDASWLSSIPMHLDLTRALTQ
jgi:hypothetical protein